MVDKIDREKKSFEFRTPMFHKHLIRLPAIEIEWKDGILKMRVGTWEEYIKCS